MIREQDVVDALDECERYVKRAKEWLKCERNDNYDSHTISRMIRSSMDLSEALVKMRGRRNK